MTYLYILLTRSSSLLSRLIRRGTGDEYTHVSLALDGYLDSLCSFARLRPGFPLPAGLVRESLYEGYYSSNRYIPCMLLALPVEETVYLRVRSRVEEMLDYREGYRYDIRGLFLCWLGRESRRPRHYFCSRFVGEVLEQSGALPLPKPAGLLRPEDFLHLPGLLCLYRGPLAGLMHRGAAGGPPLLGRESPCFTEMP